jgi:hypothetical protein
MGCIWRERKAFLLVISLTRKILNSPVGSRLPILRMGAKEKTRDERRNREYGGQPGREPGECEENHQPKSMIRRGESTRKVS